MSGSPGWDETKRGVSEQLSILRRELEAIEIRLREASRARSVGFDPVIFAHRLYRARRHRGRIFRASLFADPCWDMLLDLYVAMAEQRRVSVSSACLAARVPATTALRWLGKLEKAGHVVRRPSLEDTRRIYVQLSPSAQRSMSELMFLIAGELEEEPEI